MGWSVIAVVMKDEQTEENRASAAPTISNISDLLTAITELDWSNEKHAHIRFWFRGQSDWSWSLGPGVYRNTFSFEQDSDQDTEASRLLAEHHLFQDFRVMSAGLRKGMESPADLYFLQQHHGMPTRLLDWSTIPLAALYFTVSDQERQHLDGGLYMMDAYQLAPAQNAKFDDKDFKGIATSQHPVFKNAVDIIGDWLEYPGFPAFILPVRPNHLDARVSLQRSCFTFHPPAAPELTIKQNPTLRFYRIPSDSKPVIERELAMLGIDAFTIYGDLDHLAQKLRLVRQR